MSMSHTATYVQRYHHRHAKPFRCCGCYGDASVLSGEGPEVCNQEGAVVIGV